MGALRVDIDSLNFQFLAEHELHLAQLGGLAERYFATDPNTCLLKLRQLGEVLAKQAAAHTAFRWCTLRATLNQFNHLRHRAPSLSAAVAKCDHPARVVENLETQIPPTGAGVLQNDGPRREHYPRTRLGIRARIMVRKWQAEVLADIWKTASIEAPRLSGQVRRADERRLGHRYPGIFTAATEHRPVKARIVCGKKQRVRQTTSELRPELLECRCACHRGCVNAVEVREFEARIGWMDEPRLHRHDLIVFDACQRHCTRGALATVCCLEIDGAELRMANASQVSHDRPLLQIQVARSIAWQHTNSRRDTCHEG